MDSVLEVIANSDWGSGRATRRSVSRVNMFSGGWLLFSSSRAQKLVSLTSAEAEMYACASGCADKRLLARLLALITGGRVMIRLRAPGIVQRRGVGRVRHLFCGTLWVQAALERGEVKFGAVAGAANRADVGAKRVPAAKLDALMKVLGLYNSGAGSLVGATDPGK